MAKTSQPTRAPNKALYLTNYARSAWDIGALSAALPALARAPRGDGHAVLVIPGRGASDMSTWILHRFLSTLGYATYGWELGRNIGPTARVVSGLPERLHEFRARHDGPVSMIGWSLGGIFARQLGRRHPDVIEAHRPHLLQTRPRTSCGRIRLARNHVRTRLGRGIQGRFCKYARIHRVPLGRTPLFSALFPQAWPYAL